MASDLAVSTFGRGGGGGASACSSSSVVAARLVGRRSRFQRAEAAVLVGAKPGQLRLHHRDAVAILLRLAEDVGQLPLDRVEPAVRLLTDSWVAAGSSLKPAVSAGWPLGKTCL